jgi:hypothetical protein
VSRPPCVATPAYLWRSARARQRFVEIIYDWDVALQPVEQRARIATGAVRVDHTLNRKSFAAQYQSMHRFSVCAAVAAIRQHNRGLPHLDRYPPL